MRAMDTLFIIENAPYIWLALGATLLALEAFGASGIGFLFAGLGAIVAAIFAHLGWAETFLSQTSAFFLATVFWAVILWMPMQKLKVQKGAESTDFNNMIGDEATVSQGGLAANITGKVRWSGTTMSAKLLAGSVPQAEGATVIIKQVKGTVLTVAPITEDI